METTTKAKLRIAGAKIGDDIHYGRENNGDWILMLGDDEEAVRFGTVSMVAKAKRGQGWNTPDPEGFARAQAICDMWNARDA
jgi:hypothetical protein